jgi:uncharacterized membrane protein
MIALALVPTAAITGMGLATAQIELAGKGLLRWAMDLGLVVGASLLVLAWKRARVQKRKMLF